MPKINSSATQFWTHRAYFKRYRLNPEQYGEILTAQTFTGDKKGDAQPCFDVESTEPIVREQLLNLGVSLVQVEKCLSCVTDGKVRIEVKSRQAKDASVIHCNDNKIHGARQHLPATHFAIILFNDDGFAGEAWFLTSNTAQQLRRKNTKSRYIAIRSLREASPEQAPDIIDIRSLINEAATCELTLE